VIGAYIRLVRPPEWVKNVFVLAAPVFAQQITDPLVLVKTALTFAAFCLLSSVVYITNDIADRHEDRLHPRKCLRPIASGQISPVAASVLAVILLAGAVVMLMKVSLGTLAIGITYLGLMLLYSWVLKHRVLLDVIVISLGFVLRALAGAVAAQVQVSPWLITCTFTLCLFLGFGKRRCELASFTDADAASQHRKTLLRYTPTLLSHLLSVTAAIAVVTFLLYSVDPRTIEHMGTNYLVYTAPLVFYAVFRYTLLVESGRASGPTDIVLNDVPFIVTAVAWAGLAVVILYAGPGIKVLVNQYFFGR
jgi:4-hydroxybenzoate polyprenyltransferase